MAPNLYPPLAPRDGNVLQVLGIARISTDKQDERSLEDQEALYRRWLADHYVGEFELTMIAGQGSVRYGIDSSMAAQFSVRSTAMSSRPVRRRTTN